jgi:hypothetical protein
MAAAIRKLTGEILEPVADLNQAGGFQPMSNGGNNAAMPSLGST